MSISLPTDFLPNPLAVDCTDALTWWLANPLLLYHYPTRMAATAAGWEAADHNERRRLLWALREVRGKARAGKALPTGLPELELPALETLIFQIPEAKERGDVLRFAHRLHPCERPWLATRLEKALAAQQAENEGTTTQAA